VNRLAELETTEPPRIMVNAANTLSPEQLSTKALAAAGQFRAIALWLNEPLIPQGIYAQVSQDRRPGCIRIIVEFERTPHQKPLTQYICHLMWQLNSPLIEGIHLVGRPIGTTKPLWEQRIRVMTSALRERLNRERGLGSSATAMPPALTPGRRSTPVLSNFSLHLLLSDQLKTVRAFMLTGSAVAAFVFGCMVEVVMSARPEPSLPFQNDEQVRSQKPALPPSASRPEPQLPAFHSEPTTITAERKSVITPAHRDRSPSAEATSISYKVEPERDRPNVINAALEPVGVLQHERLENPQDPTITLLFGGDVDLDGVPYDQLEYDGQLLSGLSVYRQADVAMVNLQDPLATAATSLQEELLERTRPDAIHLLKDGGVDLVNLTGKAALSSGEQGLDETLTTLDRQGIFRVGAGRSGREARRPEVIDVKGQRIAYLSYDRDFSVAAYDDVSGVNALELQDIVRDIQAIRDEVDWLVVNYRWSGDPVDKPANSPTNLARLAIDQGADLVVGQHPSMLQGAEIYKGRPIAYSLGDFVFGQATEEPTTETVVLQVALREGQMKVDLIPVKVKDGQPQKASGTDAQRILKQVQTASQEFQEPMPPSVVLNTRSGVSPDAPLPSEDGSFTGGEAPLTTPGSDANWEDPAETPAPEETLSPPDAMPQDEAAPPEPTTTDALPPEAPIETDGESLDIELEPIPEGLLDDWGQKESPNTIYEPESALPRPLRFNKPETETKAPNAQPEAPNPLERKSEQLPESGENWPTPDEKSSTPGTTPPLGEELEITHPHEAIGPYSEPLVGPLSSVPEPSTDMKRHQDVDTPTAQLPPGMPESRVFEPLNTSEPPEKETITIKGQEPNSQDPSHLD
jgi:poly-gamma-glutamate capsule biosynthesis protein CapA/YwtB (metallophosphatase superfamily)